MLSPLPVTTLTFDSPVQGPSVTAAPATSPAPLVSVEVLPRGDLTFQPVLEKIAQPEGPEVATSDATTTTSAPVAPPVTASAADSVDEAARDMTDSSSDDTRFQFTAHRRPPPPSA